MEQQGDKDSAAHYLAQAAVREAEIGDRPGAGRFIAKAQMLSHDQDVTTLAALIAARLGESARAESLSAQLSHQFPAGTYIQRYWLPLIRAEAELSAGRPLKAVEDLSLLNPPLEFAGPPAFSVPTLYPAYIRAQAYLAAGDGMRAAAEFQKLLDHKAALANYPLAPMAVAGLAQAYARAGDRQKARQSYAAFFETWKSADHGLKLLEESRSAFARLQ
jgi:Tfp pilus assembly protein PilF